jgi:Zn finger protein HypA/HybF involved in hydrogenase expression
MTSPLEPTFSYEKSNYEQTCNYCGCVFQVVAPGQKGHEESEEYYCPECNKEYRTRASNSPRVTLIKARTDGRTDSYKN